MEFMKHYYDHFSSIIRSMTGSQMVLMVSVAAGVMVAALFLFGVFKSVTYVTLYSDLDSESVAEVIDRLDELSIKHEIAEGGNTVKVPSGDVYSARMRLAALGLPKSGTVGYSIFDQTNLGMTEFLQKINFRRALEGELARSVMALGNVDAARVHVVIPEDHLFEEDKRPPTASVLLKLSTGSTVTPRQIRGITHLIAASVEGMSPDNISIIDYNGNLLTQTTGTDELASLSGTQLELRKNVEKYLENKAQTLLDNSVGNGKSIVRVTASLNFNQSETTLEQYDPDNLAVRSEERTEESNSDASSNTLDSTSTNTSSTVENSITNYEVNRTVQRVVNSVGNIEKLTVAVLVDGHYETVQGEDGAGVVEYKPRDDEEMNRLTALVKNAVGYDETRNDKIEVVSMQFDSRSLVDDQKSLDDISTRSFYMDVGKKVLMLLAAVFLFFYGKKKIKKLFAAFVQYVPPMPKINPMTPQQESPVSVQPQKMRLVDQMKKTAEDRPDEIAKVIRTIMTD
ncbi:MAG: flagellar M-ring protein FliF [candidate division Zixibacteria bacterium]|nr:flagellar M-ring protein FliF [candidate division Zixibacteria bacterium]MBU1471483.1 flagellar M-ring protein FliF [candidate division Zixibacteria bacterium]